MYDAIWKATAGQVSPDRMMHDLRDFFELSRWSSFDKILALAELIGSRMEDAGMTEVRLIEFPADGTTAYGGWYLPKAYDVDEARLTIFKGGQETETLADYQANPTSLMMYSRPTPPEGITAELVVADQTEDMTPERVQGKMVLTSRLGVEISQSAIRSGAVGVVCDLKGVRRFIKEGAYLDETNEWHNYSIPPWDDDDKGFGFAITPNCGRALRARIESGERVHVYALVRSRHYDGNLPVISGILPGRSREEIAITGHYDEFGADDNCSQVAVAVEAIRILKALIEAGEIAPLSRSIRILLPMEVRGFNALIQDLEETRNLRAGLNIDTVGTDQNRTTTYCTLTEDFPALPSYADDLAAELLERVSQETPLFRWKASGTDTIDNIFGEPLVGAPTPAIYHSSATHHVAADTPDLISERMLEDMARLVATYTGFLANAGTDEALWLSELSAERGMRRFQEFRAQAVRGVPPDQILKRLRSLSDRYRRKVSSSLWMVPGEKPFYTAEAMAPRTHSLRGENRLLPREYYAERTEELGLKVAGAVAETERAIVQISEEHFGLKPSEGLEPTDSRCVPVKAFRGFLSFENLSREDKERLREEFGIGAGWGAPMWINHALTFANGKRTAADIVGLLQLHGLANVTTDVLEQMLAFLESKDLVRFRKYVEREEVRKALLEVGVEPGDTVLGHFSLSAFGYLEGGAEGLIDTLLEVLGPAGTLMMPTFTFSYVGHRPYDPAQSPSRTGAVTDSFWRRDGVLRSGHPTHSFAAAGKHAARLLEDHHCESSALGRQSPAGRLYDLDGKILMFCQPGPNSSMHCGDQWEGIPYPDFLCHVIEGGERREVIVPDSPWHARFDGAYERLRTRQQLASASLGESEIHQMQCRHAIDAQAETARETPEALIAPDCNCPYCQELKRYCAERG